MSIALYLLLITLSLIWGGSFFFIKLLLPFHTPFVIVFYRSLFGLLAIIVIMLVMKKPFYSKNLPWKSFVFIGVINSVIPWTVISYSETLISSSLASILNATTPIWTLLIGILFFSTKIKGSQWVGVILGFIGIFVLLDIDFSQLSITNYYGFLGMIIAALFYGLSSQFSKKYFGKISVYQISFYTILASTIVTGIIVSFTDHFNWSYLFMEKTVVFSIFGLGSFGSGLAFLIYYHLIQKGSAEFASLVTYLVPVTAIFWGVTLLGEGIRPSMIMGLLFVLLGVYVSGRKKREHSAEQALADIK